MAMTRQHFVKIAEIIAGHEDLNRYARESLAVRFADMLADTNPNFDRGRFLKACAGSEKKAAA